MKVHLIPPIHYVPFLPDDTISYKVTINPNASQDTDVPVGPNTTARSFRVKMKLT